MPECGPGAVAAFLERGVQVGARGADGGRQAEENAGEQRDAEGEEQHAPVEPDGGSAFANKGQVGGADGEQGANADVADKKAEDASAEREHEALGEQLANDADAAGTHGSADGELPLAAGGTHEQQIGDVGAGDEQDEAHSSEQNEQRGAGVGNDGIAQRLHAEAGFGIGERPAAAEFLVGELHLRVGLRQGDARPEPRRRHEVVALVGAVGIDLEGQPDVGHGIGAELLADDAEDRVRLIAERKRGADDVGIAAELTLPEAVADHDHVSAVGRIFLRREGAAEDHRCSEEAEVRFAHVNAVDLFGHFAGEVKAWTAEVVRGDILQNAGLRAPVVELGGG